MNSKKTNITIFATYWNEKDWIEASLAQIDAIDPQEVIICDGCFDPSKPNYSTDGTREIIEKWVSERPHTRMISALRLSRIHGLYNIFSRHITLKFLPLRKIMIFYYLRTNVYRINQAATFNKMTELAKHWKPGNWSMFMDADQFYPDEMIDAFKQVCDNPNSDIDLITAKERTFFGNFDEQTTEYEARNFNNMPHRIKENILIVPTRDTILEEYPRPQVYGKHPDIKRFDAGYYLHYKFHPFDKEREAAAYTLGDRKPPSASKYKMEKFEGEHPKAVERIVQQSRSFS
jgi:hypothetical protein